MLRCNFEHIINIVKTFEKSKFISDYFSLLFYFIFINKSLTMNQLYNVLIFNYSHLLINKMCYKIL